MRTWATCKPQKTLPHARTGARLFQVERWQRTKALLCRSSQDSREDRDLYQAKTVKTHSNNLVMLTHVQLKPFYRLSTRDVTHVRKCTRPSPALPYCKRREAGRGPGYEAMVFWESGFVQIAMYQFHILGYSYDLVGHAQTERCELVLLTVHFPIRNIVKEHWI